MTNDDKDYDLPLEHGVFPSVKGPKKGDFFARYLRWYQRPRPASESPGWPFIRHTTLF
jgi:hypothetical protein